MPMPMPVPDDMMRFVVPGSQAEMDALRALYWEHYIPDGPLWDEWLRGPDLFPMYPIVPMGPKAPLWDEWLLPALLAPDRGVASARMQALWNQALSARSMDDEGYVATHQNVSYAHQAGWPFPIWSHGEGGLGLALFLGWLHRCTGNAHGPGQSSACACLSGGLGHRGRLRHGRGAGWLASKAGSPLGGGDLAGASHRRVRSALSPGALVGAWP
ncbi:MAG: hypothetical protein J7M15_01075 [Anaerolineae bacterium]|nr:hypothetical protein [Anaerolineae bacterium]